MNKKHTKKNSIFCSITILLIIFCLGYAFAGWHSPSQIVSGTFLQDYVFNGNVSINVTPTQPNHVATKEYVDAQSGDIEWVGYTSTTYNGNLGGTQGAHEKCATEYTGSRAMNYNDWQKLGSEYPWTYNAWLLDGAKTIDSNRQITMDGLDSSTNFPLQPMCQGWTKDYQYGPYLHGDLGGGIRLANCASAFRLACVR